jgi:hypothetical protein
VEDAIDTIPLTVSQLASLPATVDLMTAARILGIGRTKAFELARQGAFPCLEIRVGDLYRVSTPDLLRICSGNSASAQRTPMHHQLPHRDANEHVIASSRTVKPRSNDQEPGRHSLAIRL